jgi:preprotein translocase subunit YajC
MLGFLISNVYAQEALEAATTAAPAQPSALTSMLPLVMVFAIFYILMIRPQKKRADKEREYISNIKKGTEIYMKSGMIGTITSITEKVITLEVEGGTKIKVLRSQVGGELAEIYAKKDDKDKKQVASKA